MVLGNDQIDQRRRELRCGERGPRGGERQVEGSGTLHQRQGMGDNSHFFIKDLRWKELGDGEKREGGGLGEEGELSN